MNIDELKRRSEKRAEELRQSKPRLRFGANRKPLPRLHAEDAGAGLYERYEIPRGLR